MYANQTVKECDLAFLDCRGYYDLAAEIVGLLLTGIILYRALNNYRQLKRQKGTFDDTEYEHSLRRKIRVNLLNIIFLFVFFTHIIFSMILFQIVNEQSSTYVTSNRLQKWYKSTEILFIELLNVLLITVGWLYWKGLNFFYKIKQLQPPLPFKNGFKYLLYGTSLYCIFCFIIGMIFIFQKADDDQFLLNIFMLLGSVLSMVLFLFFRLAYYTNIFRSVKLGRKVIIRERIYNIVVVFSSLTRMTLLILGMTGANLDQLRIYNSECHDTSPQHGIVLLSITLCVDLIPPLVFSRIFTTFGRQKHCHADIEQTLFSLQPSEMASGISKE